MENKAKNIRNNENKHWIKDMGKSVNHLKLVINEDLNINKENSLKNNANEKKSHDTHFLTSFRNLIPNLGQSIISIFNMIEYQYGQTAGKVWIAILLVRLQQNV